MNPLGLCWAFVTAMRGPAHIALHHQADRAEVGEIKEVEGRRERGERERDRQTDRQTDTDTDRWFHNNFQ